MINLSFCLNAALAAKERINGIESGKVSDGYHSLNAALAAKERILKIEDIEKILFNVSMPLSQQKKESTGKSR